MKILTTIAVAAAMATLSGCVVAPARGYYQYRDPAYDRRYQGDQYDNRYRGDRNYRYRGDARRHDGDHAGGTNPPD